MSWPQWSSGTQPPVPPVINPAAPVNPAPAVVPPGMQYTPEQWAQLQHQNWQQWAQWQQQYQQWHQQYGAEYQKSMNAIAQAAQQQASTPLLNVGIPPPLPAEPKPPLPAGDPPPISSYTSTSGYTTAQPPQPVQPVPPVQPGYQTSAPLIQPGYTTAPPLVKNNDIAPASYAKSNQNWAPRFDPSIKRAPEPVPAVDPKRKPNWPHGVQQQQPPPVQRPRENVEELSEAEKKFDKQFAEWEAQFNKWKEQNVEHPDKTQYREYEKKWESWRAQLLERREQMKRKRLGLTANSPQSRSVPGQSFNQPPPGFNASQPPNYNATLPPNFNASGPPPGYNTGPPTSFNPPKAVQAPAATVSPFNKPPPNLNNEPLAFKHAKSADTGDDEKVVDFIKPNTEGGIPGLDLVKDEPPSKTKVDDDVVVVEGEAENEKEKKGPDFVAISKGINTILGDKKLLNMLSLVSQNPNSKISENITNSVAQMREEPAADMAYLEQSNQSHDEQSRHAEGYGQRESVTNFDDQTRSSFTAGHNEQEMRFEPPGNFGRSHFVNRFGGFDKGREGFDNEPARNIPGRTDFSGDRLNDRDKFGSNQDVFSQGNQFPNREQFGPSRDKYRTYDDQDRFGQDRFNQNAARFGPNRDRFGPNDDRFAPNEERFAAASSADNDKFGPNQDKFTQNQNRFVPIQDRFGPGPDRFGPNQDRFGGPNQDRFGANQDRFGGNQSKFAPNKDNFSHSQDGFGGNLDKFSTNKEKFGSAQERFGLNSDRFGSNQNRFGVNQDRFGTGQDRFGFQQNQDRFRPNQERYEQDQYNDYGPGDRYSGGNNSSEEQGRYNYEEEGYEDYHEEYDDNYDYDYDEVAERFEEPINEPPGEENITARSWQHKEEKFHDEPCEFKKEELPLKEPDILQPATVIDYDHKPPKDSANNVEILLEPIYMFDYRHKPLSRIPLPQRPKWLSEAVKSIREFDPPNLRPFPPPGDSRRGPPDNWRNDRYLDDNYEKYPPRRGYDRPPPFDEKRSYSDRSSFHERSFNETPYNERPQPRRGEKRPISEERNFKSLRGDDLEEEKISDTEWPEDEEMDQAKSPIKKELFPKFDKMETGSKPRVKTPTLVEDLISPPGRYNRPPRIVIILRGPPGSGKTFLAKLIKDKEVENGGSAPRILSLDDYFMVEQEKEITEEGKKVKIKEMVYEYEAEMEESYRTSLVKSFKKTITDGYFSFIIVDNINDKVKYFGEMWSFAKQNGFQVYICQLDLDVQTCSKRNIHGRSEADIEKCVKEWEPTPSHHPVLDTSSLLQAASIPEVEMEEVNSPEHEAHVEGSEDQVARSKWDNFDCSVDNLAKLDGVNKPLRHSRTMEEYLRMDDEEWTPTKPTKPGQKRVRWADLEERKEQEKMRAIGFVVGQTNWTRMMDPTYGGSALTQTKYIEKTGRYNVNDIRNK